MYPLGMARDANFAAEPLAFNGDNSTSSHSKQPFSRHAIRDIPLYSHRLFGLCGVLWRIEQHCWRAVSLLLRRRAASRGTQLAAQCDTGRAMSRHAAALRRSRCVAL